MNLVKESLHRNLETKTQSKCSRGIFLVEVFVYQHKFKEFHLTKIFLL